MKKTLAQSSTRPTTQEEPKNSTQEGPGIKSETFLLQSKIKNFHKLNYYDMWLSSCE